MFRRFAPGLTVALISLALATFAVAILQDSVGVPNPSAVYLVAVVATALVAGTIGAVLTSVAAFLLYNYLFTEPRFTFSMHEPGVWLSVVLLLFVAIVVGQLAALMRSRAETGRTREREARALFRLSRALATRLSTDAALTEITQILTAESRMAGVGIALGGETGERLVATSGRAEALLPTPAAKGLHYVLQRTPGDEPARWARVHQPATRGGRGGGGRSGVDTFRVRIEVGGAPFGSIWALRDRGEGGVDATETRLLSAAADQIGQALVQDRFAVESQAAEVARQSDALKSALLQSVSHDLRTPLATIRAAAGTLQSDVLDVPARRESALAIEREAEYLNRVVTNLLDLSRIEAGALRVEREAIELEDVLGRTLARLRPKFAGGALQVALEAPPVEVDPVLLDEAFANVAENALRHTTAGTTVRVSARQLEHATVRLTVEDAGAGVPAHSLPLLFDRFYRAPGRQAASRDGTGIGLTVAKGLVEAMGGSIGARKGDLGGLAIDIDLPRAEVPAELAPEPSE